ncbi:hypothetical protein [Legionella cardiaca]|uniref:Uncharacterized protein n=1 Tax=Legionella cardiaca TaxID=1071983 RepID=A0ABY8AVE9_9GAMM|nr:hypothetical protein [Legionella cardiaca]WED43102.1 hypothetical protein PXX05_14565 [Legionella cardiaca]
MIVREAPEDGNLQQVKTFLSVSLKADSKLSSSVQSDVFEANTFNHKPSTEHQTTAPQKTTSSFEESAKHLFESLIAHLKSFAHRVEKLFSDCVRKKDEAEDNKRYKQ